MRVFRLDILNKPKRPVLKNQRAEGIRGFEQFYLQDELCEIDYLFSGIS